MKPPPLPLEEAQARLLGLVQPLPIERSDIAGALGRWLAEPVTATRTQPAADLSAMDGYAVASGDGAGPWTIIGESAAGHPFAGTVQAGQAVRISTGAALPEGAASVILQEDTARDGDLVRLTGEGPNPEGKHIRRQGMDFVTGAAVLSSGTRLGPAQLALATAAGRAHVAVRRRPKLAIIDSGDELAADCENCPPHQIPASNGVMLAAMAAAVPCVTTRIGPVADSLDALLAAFEQAASADVIVTSGGASVGDHDLIRPALEKWGAELDFWRVAIKPGKPILVAQRARAGSRQIILGLPGNPVSSHVTAYLFLLPLLRAISGAANPLPRRIRARLAAPLNAGGARREFLRANWDGESVTPRALQDSGAIAPLAASNALIDRAAGAPVAASGSDVMIYLLENGGIA